MFSVILDILCRIGLKGLKNFLVPQGQALGGTPKYAPGLCSPAVSLANPP